MEVPKIDSNVTIESIKFNHSLHRRWEENIVLSSTGNIVIGFNDKTKVTEGSGATWKTMTPALFYFDNRYWFNIIYVMKEKEPYYYCNISSPYTFQHNKIQYVDYDIDFIVRPDYTYTIVDQEEYSRNKKYYKYPEIVQQHIKKAEKELQAWIEQRKAPFRHEFINFWQDKMNNICK